MPFDWDKNKDRINQRKHGLSFETAACVFEDPAAISYKDRVVDGEQRRHTIGVAGGIMIVLAVPVVKHKNVEEEMRIISARKADRRERALYESHH